MLHLLLCQNNSNLCCVEFVLDGLWVHGGKISVIDFADGILSIIMSGGCQGCASSTATLRNGFEAKARLVAPELVELIDVTDHAAGTSPFYPADSQPNSQP